MERDIDSYSSLLVYFFTIKMHFIINREMVCKLLFLKGDENDGLDEDSDEDGERMINEFVTQQLQGFT